MIYPKNFETKIGFDEIRALLKQHCQSPMGKEWVERMSFSVQAEAINEWLEQTREFRLISEQVEDFPLHYLFDVREAVARLKLEGTHLEESELFDLQRSLETANAVVAFLCKKDVSIFHNKAGHLQGPGMPTGGHAPLPSGDKETLTEEDRAQSEGDDTPVEALPYPALARLAAGITVLPHLVTRISGILDKYGRIRDDASEDLGRIRRELQRTENSISHTLNSILHTAQSDGLVEKDVAPTMRDGRLVIPIAPTLKRRIKGIVHDVSSTGKTVFVEPAEVVEANNRIRELEADERREVTRILTQVSADLRPHVADILSTFRFLGYMDFVRAKAGLAQATGAIEPSVGQRPLIDWTAARHPLLQLSLARQGKKVVPLDITLNTEKRLLIISGPNAGGKSVCLKTVGLLQYMLQCGLSIPLSERSATGCFNDIMIDIGDEQSIADDLSTYSSHLLNMKNMMRQASGRTLLLIDEFGGGTEPMIGGAIAESVLRQFCEKKAYGVITTHYQNLKHFADNHEGVANGAMLYDRHEMRPLFQLSIGQPGSSFAIEIARKTGLPEKVIAEASELVGTAYVQSDKYLQDIVRDKRYWESKRQTIHQQEKQLEEKIARYEREIKELEQSRKDILNKAKVQAEDLLKESNRRIEQAIKEIREQQAEKEKTKRIREELNTFKDEVSEVDTKAQDELIAKKMRQIQERKERREKRKKEKRESCQDTAARQGRGAAATDSSGPAGGSAPLTVGDYVRIKGLTSVGRIETVDGKMTTVIFGDMRTKMRTDRLERAGKPEQGSASAPVSTGSRMTREAIDNRKLHFKQDLDVRGMRGDEALTAVTYFIDDAILVGMPRVRILHGTGSGILRQLIRQYLDTVPNVTGYRDEHVQFGGAGITVVDIAS